MTDTDLQIRIADLERRVASLEHITMPMMPLGPRPEDPRERDEAFKRVVDHLLRGQRPRCGTCGGTHRGPICTWSDGDGSLRERISEVTNG